jgi:putative spermidine/putrescine transport system substrate-binding protein
MRFLRSLSIVAAAGALLCAPAMAFEPVGAPTLNIRTNFDLKALTHENFEATLLAPARAGGTVVFYDLAESFTPLFTETVIPAFERATGVKVEYRQVNGDQTVQQLIAAQRAGQPLHVDLMWYPNGQVRLGTETGIIANLPLSLVLPNARDLDPSAARVSRGYEHGGTVLPWHRNLTAIGFDTRVVQPDRAPRSFPDLLAFARANPGTVAITSPARGGSGQGFLESAILAMTTAECQSRLFDFSFGPQEAEAWATGPCLAPVIAYFRDLKPHVEFTNGNTDTLNLIANGVTRVATVWEDQVFDFIGRGLLPPTVRLALLSSGQVGDGDGIVVPAGTRNPAGALLFANFLMSDDIQVRKLGLVGSRSARADLNLSGLPAGAATRLVPQDQVATLSRKRIVATASSEATKRFVADVLQR